MKVYVYYESSTFLPGDAILVQQCNAADISITFMINDTFDATIDEHLGTIHARRQCHEARRSVQRRITLGQCVDLGMHAPALSFVQRITLIWTTDDIAIVPKAQHSVHLVIGDDRSDLSTYAR
jgi:hypothetical protein